jgi:hypothetical protein
LDGDLRVVCVFLPALKGLELAGPVRLETHESRSV